MNSKPLSFQLEKTLPGTFAMQGLLGGALGGFVAAFVAAIAWNNDNLVMTLDLTKLAVFTGGLIGMIKATVIWSVVRLTGIQYRASIGVAATIILASLFFGVIGLQFDFDESFLVGCFIWSLSVGLPVAMLVGSKVKPWGLFTFGSIAADDQRSSSRSVLATLGTLPLRFLSIAAVTLLLLYFTREFARIRNVNDVLGLMLFLSVVCFYPLFSAYLTFRSPRKIVLCVIGVIINFPMTLIWVLTFREYLQDKTVQKVLIYALISGSFLVAWLMFLIGRLSLKLSPAQSLSISSNKCIATAPNLDHHCLGSRFTEWQQRAA